MFFNFKTRKSVTASEQEIIQKEIAQKNKEFEETLAENKKIFCEKVCHMVHSLPKEREIVVVQRRNIFNDKHHRNECYLEMARRMSYEHRVIGKNWISGYYDSLYAFYKPTKCTLDFERALNKFSKNGYRIQRIRYYKDRF